MSLQGPSVLPGAVIEADKEAKANEGDSKEGNVNYVKAAVYIGHSKVKAKKGNKEHPDKTPGEGIHDLLKVALGLRIHPHILVIVVHAT